MTDFFYFPLEFAFDQDLLAQSMPAAQRSYSLLAGTPASSVCLFYLLHTSYLIRD